MKASIERILKTKLCCCSAEGGATLTEPIGGFDQVGLQTVFAALTATPISISTTTSTTASTTTNSLASQTNSSTISSRASLSSGAIAGIVIGGLVLGVVAVGIWLITRYRRRNVRPPQTYYFSPPDVVQELNGGPPSLRLELPGDEPRRLI